MYDSELLKELIKRINSLTMWVNAELIILIMSLVSIIAGAIIVVNNWKLGHETADELSRLIIGQNMFLISIAVSLVVMIMLAKTAAARKNRINELAKLGLSVGYNRVNVACTVLPFVPAGVIIATLLVFIIAEIFR